MTEKINVKARRRKDHPITDAALAEAIERGKKRNEMRVRAASLHYIPETNSLQLFLPDAFGLTLPVQRYPELSGLSTRQLKSIELGMGGSALFLRSEDLHMSLAGLVAASTSLQDVAVSLAASKSGSKRSSAKASASRENGKKGGRPRKSTELEPASG